MRSPLRLGVEAVGWLVVGAVALTAAGERWPAFGCRVLGHDPNRWAWRAADGHEETSCRSCGATLVRECEPVAT